MYINHFPSQDFAESGSTGRRLPAPFGAPERPVDLPELVLRGESADVRRLRSQVERVAPYFRTALVRGDAGTGKQMVARALHRLGAGANSPFVTMDAAVLAQSMLQGAEDDQSLEQARGGTLYLCGVGELTPVLQGGLLRFLRRRAERRASTAGMRLIASTDTDLRTLVSIGQYRQELYISLSVVELVTPALRLRLEDLPLLADAVLSQLAEQAGVEPKLLASNTLEQLQSRAWTQNLPELRRVLAHAAATAEGSVIEPRHLAPPAEPHERTAPRVRVQRLEEVIQAHVLDVLTQCAGNKLRAAELLGISRSTLYRMLESAGAGSKD